MDHSQKYTLRTFWFFYLLAVLIPIGVMVFALGLFPDRAAGVTHASYMFTRQHNLVPGSLFNTIYFAFKEPLALLVLLFAVAPSLAAIIVSFSKYGRQGLKDLFSSFKPWRNGVGWKEGLRIYGIVLGGILLYLSVCFVLLAIWGNPEDLQESVRMLGGNSLVVMLLAFIFACFTNDGGTLEELGWRGFGLPILMDRMKSPLKASLLLGFLWAAWHLPREAITVMGGVSVSSWLIGQLCFFIMCISSTVVITYLFNLTGGSVLIAVMIHGGMNTAFGLAGGHVNGIIKDVIPHAIYLLDIRTWIFIILAFIIVWRVGPELGRRNASTASLISNSAGEH